MRFVHAAVILLVMTVMGCFSRKQNKARDGSVIVITPTGAWCWFQDPRAVYHEGRHRRTYTGWVTANGRLQVGSYDHDSGALEVVTIREKWEKDDHASPSLLVRPDGRIMLFYSTHNGDSLLARLTERPEDVSAWSDDIVITSEGRITYPNPMQLSEEGGRLYLLWRGSTWKPTLSISDNGTSWSPPVVLIQDRGREAGSIRPYLKADTDGVRTIHLAFTDGHPRNEPTNSIYYLRYTAGGFFRADGTQIGKLEQLPIPHSVADMVYDGETTNVRAWVWDVAHDEYGRPVIAYTRLPKESDHRYHYARWNGSTWVDLEITRGGGWFPQTREGKKEREPHYSGGMVLDHGNPSVVYLSRPIDGVFEIERWTTADGGLNWKSEALTSGSAGNNVRPVAPRGYHGPGDHLLWMQGAYVHYTDYRTSIKMLVP